MLSQFLVSSNHVFLKLLSIEALFKRHCIIHSLQFAGSSTLHGRDNVTVYRDRSHLLVWAS